jgi:hypothetical protein
VSASIPLLCTGVQHAAARECDPTTEVDLLQHLTPKVGEKDGFALVAGTVKPVDGHYPRGASSMHSMTAFAVDIDEVFPEDMEAILASIKPLHVRHVWYETYSHGSPPKAKDKDPGQTSRIRLWFPFSVPVLLEGVSWKASYLKMCEYFDVLDVHDPACHDTCRLMFTARHPEGQTRRMGYDAASPCFDPTPFIVLGVTRPKYAPVARQECAVVIDKVAMTERLRPCGEVGATPNTQLAADNKLVLAGKPIISGVAGGDRYPRYLHLFQSWAYRIKPEEAHAESIFQAMAEESVLASFDADGDNPGGKDGIEGARAKLVKALEGGLDNALPGHEARKAVWEAKKAARAAKSAADFVSLNRFNAEHAQMQHSPVLVPDGVRALPLNLIKPPDGKAFADAEQALAALYGAAERPIVVRLSGSTYVGEWHTERVGKEDLDLFRPVQPKAFLETLKGVKYLQGDRTFEVGPLFLQSCASKYNGVVCIGPGSSKPAPVGPYNLWDPKHVGIKPLKGDVTIALDVLKTLVGRATHEEYLWLLKTCSYMVQHPTEQPMIAILMKGAQGTGKSWWWDMIKRMHGSHGRLIDSAEALQGKHNDVWAGACFVIIVDIDTRGAERDITTLLKNKTMSDTITIEPKNVSRYAITNSSSIVMLTNDMGQVLDLETDDRRWVVFECTPPRFPAESEESKALWAPKFTWRDEEGGAEAVYEYLLNYPLGDFKPAFPHPHTEAWKKEVGMKQEADGTVATWVTEVRTSGVVMLRGTPIPLASDGTTFLSSEEALSALREWWQKLHVPHAVRTLKGLSEALEGLQGIEHGRDRRKRPGHNTELKGYFITPTP